jgi:hypothetical protein
MTSVAIGADARAGWGWVRNARFDQLLILGTAGTALLAGLVVMWRPSLLPLMLALDVLLLGRQHIMATYTRIAMDGESFRQHRFLVVWLPLLTAGGVVGLYLAGGGVLVQTLYFYFQWFHYVRQGYGVERIHARAAGGGGRPDRLAAAVIYLVPIWGLLVRSARGAETASTFMGLPLHWLPAPGPVVALAGAAALVALAAWLRRTFIQARAGTLGSAHALYVVSHVVLFTVAYVAIPRPDHGWLVVNVWHNFQYVLVVWLFNVNRFRGGVDPARRFLSTLSQPRSVIAYVFCCTVLGTALYLTVDSTAGWMSRYGLPAGMVLYATINFHHYVVDAVVWKLRRPEIRRSLVTG